MSTGERATAATERALVGLGAAGEAIGRLAGLIGIGARRESTRRRALWIAIAALLVVGPVAFNLGRESHFRASVEIYPGAVAPYARVAAPAYWRGLLRDPELRRQTALNVGNATPDYAHVSLAADPRTHALRLTYADDTPSDARTVVNALGPQLAGASSRQLSRRAQADAIRIRAELTGRVPAARRAALRRRLAAVVRLGPFPPPRAVVGPRASNPRLDGWGDRLADALPGPFPRRASPLAAGLAGLAVAMVLWLLGLVVVPPAGALAALVAQPEPTPPWLRAVGRWFKPDGPPPPPRAPPDPRPPRLALIGVAAAIVLAGALVFWAGRGTTFLADEWAFILGRRGGGAGAYLEPHNQHFVLVLASLYKALFATVGLSDYWPYRVAAVLANACCLAAVFVYARTRIGWVMAAALAAPILVFGPAFDVLLFPFDLPFSLSVAAGVAGLLALERKDRRGDGAACALLLVSLMTSEIGLCFALGAAIELLLQRDRKRLWIAAAPAAVYVVWWVAYGADQASQGPFKPFSAPAYAFHMAANAFTSLLALPLGVETQSHGYHRVLEVLGYALVLAAAVFTVRRVLHIGRLTPRLGALVATTLSFWILTGASRAYAGDWYASRYVYPSAALVLVVVSELARGVRVPRRATIALAGLAVLLAAGNAGWLLKDSAGRRADTEVLAAELGATEIARAHVPPQLPVDQQRAPYVTAEEYLEVRDALGSPAMPAAEIPHASMLARDGADLVLRRSLVGFRPAVADPERPGAPVAIDGSARPFVKRRSRCVTVNTPRGRSVLATFVLPAAGIVLIPRGTPEDRRPVRISLLRFALTGPAARYSLGRSGEGWLLVAAPDRVRRPWRVAVRASRRFSVC